MKTLLLTGTINPNFFDNNSSKKTMNVYLNDPNKRLNEYSETIEKYLLNTSFDSVVFIENSDWVFPLDKYVRLAKENNKQFEFIKRELSESEKILLIEKGKSYGEADMIKYAVNNSKLIKQSDSFYKVTGRVFLLNSEKILNKHNNSSKFITKNKIGWSNTEFFQVNKDDYYKYLDNDLLYIDDYEAKNIERVWFNLIKDKDIKLKRFSSYPRLSGNIAGTKNDKYDKTKMELIICSILLKIGYFDLKRSSK